MRMFSMKWIMLLVALMLTASCGGGGGSSSTETNTNPADTTLNTGAVPNGNVTITVVSPTTGTTTNTYTGTYYTPDPTLFAQAVTSIDFNASMIVMHSSSVTLDLIVAAATPGTYTGSGLDTSFTTLAYTIHDSPTNPTTYACTDGTIVLTAVGGEGIPFTGTFQGTFKKISPVADPTNTLQLSGSFTIY